MSGLALATVAATLLLILFGGLVTNTGAGLVVPDWPTTFGHTMFLFPWSGEQATVLALPVAHHIVWSSLALAVVSLLATVLGMAGSVYLVAACALGTIVVAVGARQALTPSVAATRRVLLVSLVYLPILLAILAVDKR